MKYFVYIILYLVAVNAFAQQKPDFRNDYYDNKRAQQESIPKVNGAIVMLGNSLTERGLWWEYFPGKKILNRGIGGDILCGMIDRLPDILKNKPSKMFITAGINDILFHNITKEEFEIRYDTIINLISREQPRCRIYLESLLPVNDIVNPGSVFLKDKNGTIKEFNELIKEIAKKHRLKYIDIHSGLLDDGHLNAGYTADGIHLNEKGYLIWATLLKPYINE